MIPTNPPHHDDDALLRMQASGVIQTSLIVLPHAARKTLLLQFHDCVNLLRQIQWSFRFLHCCRLYVSFHNEIFTKHNATQRLIKASFTTIKLWKKSSRETCKNFPLTARRKIKLQNFCAREERKTFHSSFKLWSERKNYDKRFHFNQLTTNTRWFERVFVN